MTIPIEVHRFTTERVTYSRDEVIGLLMEDEDYFSDADIAEGRRLWSECSDDQLAEFLAERLNDGTQYATDTVVTDFGQRGYDVTTWTVQKVKSLL